MLKHALKDEQLCSLIGFFVSAFSNMYQNINSFITFKIKKQNWAKWAKHLYKFYPVVSMAFCALIFFVNKSPPCVFKKTMTRKVCQKKERKRAQNKLTVSTVHNIFPFILLLKNWKTAWPNHFWKCRVIPQF